MNAITEINDDQRKSISEKGGIIDQIEYDFYTKKELAEINHLIYSYNGVDYTSNEEEEPEFDSYEFEENGWESYDCEYGIIGGCCITDDP